MSKELIDFSKRSEGTVKNLERVPNNHIYLASSNFPWLNTDHDKWIMDAMHALDKNDTVASVHLPWNWQYKDASLDNNADVFGSFEWAQKTYDNDITAMGKADVCVALVDVDNKDVGVIYEIGWLSAMGIKTVAVLLSSKDTLQKEYDGNLMLTQSIQHFINGDGDWVKELEEYNFNHMPANVFTDLGDNFKII